jgi:hypothetical protein
MNVRIIEIMKIITLKLEGFKRYVSGFTMDDIELISDNPLHGVINAKVMNSMRKKNDLKINQVLRSMDNKWVCHPDNRVKRLDGREYR